MSAEPGPPAGFDAEVSPDGRATLGPHTTALRQDLDRCFAAWGAGAGAAAATYPPVLRVEDLARLDYFVNFPHLASLVTGLDPRAVADGSLRAAAPAAIAPDRLAESGHALPSAACYSAYLDLAGTVLTRPARITTSATCFRREEKFEGLRRLFGFTMREIVCVGPRDAVLDHLSAFKARITAFLADLALPVRVQAAADPFFDPDGGRSLMAKLFPVKEEFVFGGSLAIASVNFHRNFFGERCEIRLEDGSHAFSGCVAFGLERWIAALAEHFDGDLGAARRALAGCAGWNAR